LKLARVVIIFGKKLNSCITDFSSLIFFLMISNVYPQGKYSEDEKTEKRLSKDRKFLSFSKFEKLNALFEK
jgi:hypothetical protein